MSGVTFQALMMGGGVTPVVATFASHNEIALGANAASQTFTGAALGAVGYVIVAVSTIGVVNAGAPTLTVDGVSATLLSHLSYGGGGSHLSLFYALVTHTSGNIVITPAASASRFSAIVYSMNGFSPGSTVTVATSTAAAPTATQSVPKNSCVIAFATESTNSTATSATWTGPTEDCDTSIGSVPTINPTAAHLNFSAANASFTSTCTFTATTSQAGMFTVIS